MNFLDITNIKNYLISLLPNIIGSLLILIIFYTIANISYNYLNSSTEVTVKQESTHGDKISLAYYQIKTILYYTILSIGFIYAITNLGYFPTSLLAIFGIFTFGVGLSLKDIFTSFVSGIYLSIIKLYAIGDYIKISYIPLKTSDQGYVTDFNLFLT